MSSFHLLFNPVQNVDMFLLLNGNLVSKHTQLLIGAAIFVYRFRLFVLFPMLLRYVHIKICIKSVKAVDR